MTGMLKRHPFFQQKPVKATALRLWMERPSLRHKIMARKKAPGRMAGSEGELLKYG